MKKILLLLLALLPMLVLAQWTEPIGYDTVQKFSDGTAIVVHNGKYGLIKMGKVIVPLEYKDIKRIADDKYLIMSNGLSIADSKGNIANDVMLYTSSDEQIVLPGNNFDANIVSNTYSDGLGVIVFNKPVTSIGRSAFYYCTSLTSITIPNSVTEIGYEAFKGCTSLTSITIPNSVTTIYPRAFSGCTSLTSVTIPNSVTKIGESTFDDCTSLKAFYGKYASSDNRCLIVRNTLIAYANASGSTYSIPNGVTKIGYAAFSRCTSLRSITIPNSVTSIGDWAFAGCASLTSIKIPDGVTEIGTFAFYGCIALPVIDGIRYADTYLVEAVDKTRTSYTIKPGTRFIGSSAFSGCTSLTSITILNSVTEIGAFAFSGRTSLKSITIPNGVTSIGRSAFSGCTSLTSITIPDSVTSIGGDAFLSCTSLTSITIPDSVTLIRYRAFRGCTSLKEVYCKPMTPPMVAWANFSWDAFSDNAPGRKIYVPRASVEAYKQAEYWKDYANDIVGYDF